MSSFTVRAALGAAGATAFVGGSVICGSPALADDEAPIPEPVDEVLDLVAVGPQRTLSLEEVAAARITDTPEGQEVLATVDLEVMAGGEDDSKTALNALEASLEVYRFGSGDRQVTMTIPGDVIFMVLEGTNAGGHVIYDVAVSGGDVSDDEFAASTGGRSVQAIPGASSFSRYDSNTWNTTVGSHFDRRNHSEYFRAVKNGRRYLRGFLDGSGGQLHGGSGRDMRSMWVEFDRAPGWGAYPVESQSPQPASSNSGSGGSTCVTRGWGVEVSAGLVFPPVEFGTKLSESMTVQTCSANETYDPINRSDVASHGMVWNRYSNYPTGHVSRAVVTGVTADIPSNVGYEGWYVYSGQSDENR